MSSAMPDVGFSLYKLPNNAIINAIGAMDTISIVALSLISAKSKELVKSLNLKDTTFSLTIPGVVTVCRNLHFNALLDFHLNRDEDETKDINELPINRHQIPVQIRSWDRGHTGSVWRNPRNLNFHQLFEHFQYIFHAAEVNQIAFWCNIREISEVERLKTFLPPSKKIVVQTRSSVSAQKILEEFLPDSRILSMSFKYFPSQSHPLILSQTFGIQNLDEICISDVRNLKLEDLLTLNSRHIEIYLSQLGSLPVVANKFIKCWIRGANPRLKLISITFPGSMNSKDTAVLKGIQHTVLPEDQEYTTEICSLRRLKGGFEIRSRNGRRANFQINSCFYASAISICVFD